MYLDGLRGVAAIVVVVYHLMNAFYPSTYTRDAGDIHTEQAIEWLLHDTPIGIISSGGLAVGIFLLLSGYVASIQSKRLTTIKMVADSILKRFFRFILPIFTINIVVYCLLSLNFRFNLLAYTHTFSWWWLGNQWQFDPSLFTAFSQSFLSLFRTYPISEIYNSSVWTMPSFFLGSIFIMMLVLFTRSIPKRWIIYLALSLLLLRTNFWLLVVGMMFEQYAIAAKAWLNHPIVRFLLCISFVFFGNYPQNYTTAVFSSWFGWLPIFSFAYTSSLYQGLAAICLFLLINQLSFIQKLLNLPVWQFIGKISFSIYLFHIVVINSLTSWLFIQFISYFSYSASFGLSMLLSIPVVGLGSWLIYSLTEKKSATVSNYVRKWLVQ
jgi:peptidoglycan/LPS O-acetylase OafA/YrhL